MTSKNIVRYSLAALALAAAGAAPGPQVPPPAAPKPGLATSKDLGGADRFLSHVSTDKPIYRANEKVYVRAVLLNAATRQPLADNQQTQAQVTILGPRGETVSSGSAQSENSVVGFSWTVPEGAAGGEYTFKIAYPYQGYAPSERKFDVRIYRAPRLRSQVTFARDGYGPGDGVTATVHSERAEGGFPAGAKVTVIARVDDQQVYTGPATIDAKGDCTATFPLPALMERGEGTLAFAIEDGGVVETASKTIPILLQTLDLAIYPEGGDAVAGVPNRFYIEAKTPARKPADIVGAIYDSKGSKVADVKTEHEGRGRFSFIPAGGEKYTLKVSEPAGIAKVWNLPEAKDKGVVLQLNDDVVAKDQSVRVNIIPMGYSNAQVRAQFESDLAATRSGCH